MSCFSLTKFKLVFTFGLGLMLFLVLGQVHRLAFAQSGLLAPIVTSPPAAIAPLPIHSSVQLPAELTICLQNLGERFDRWGTVTEKNQRFYLLGIYSDFVDNNPLDATDALIVVHPGSTPWCERLLPQTGTPSQPLAAFMSPASALSLDLQRYRHDLVQLGSKPALQQQLRQKILAARGDYLLSPEQVEALHQLGVQIPTHYRLFRPTTFSNLGDSL